MEMKTPDQQKTDNLVDTFLKTLYFFGIDRAVSYGVLSRIWGVFAGPVTMIIIAARLSREQQGFYYTFSSLLALQTFFELGLLYVIAQFASHEFVQLRWGAQGGIEGDSVSRERFIDLLCKSTKWFGVASILMIVFLVPAGLYFFGDGQYNQPDFAWRIPWTLAVIGTGLNLLVTPFFAMIMGSGDVVTVNYRELIGGIAGSAISWLVLGAHGGLYAVFAVTFGNIIISWSYLFRQKPELLKLAWQGNSASGFFWGNRGAISWREEIWPMQWRMAVSSGASYFIFQLFNPILFHYHGSIVAGQMGMTLAAANALLGICFTLQIAKSPDFGKLIAVRNWKNLDRQFFRVLLQSATLAFIGAFTGWWIIWFLQKNYPVGQRFIPASHSAILLGAVCVQIVNGAFGIYLRAHKKEPLMMVSVIASIIQGALTWFLGMRYSTLGVTSGYFLVSLLFLFPSVFLIWKRCRAEWHATA
jgi:O-antigen/teichoic acid export membrane protein